MNSKEFRKTSREFEKLIGIPSSTFIRDICLLLLSLACTVCLYSLYESDPPATPGRFMPPVHKPALMVALFALCLTSIASAGWVLARGWTYWQRTVALIAIIFPSLFLLAMLLWFLKRAMT